MPVKYSWSDVKSINDMSFVAKTKFSPYKHIGEVYDAIAKYRAAYKATDMSEIGWWWHASSKQVDSPGNNMWKGINCALRTRTSINVLQILPTDRFGYIYSAGLQFYPPNYTRPKIGKNDARYLIMKIRSTVKLTRNFWIEFDVSPTPSIEVHPPKFIAGDFEWDWVEIDLYEYSPELWNGNLYRVKVYPYVETGQIEIEYILIDKEDLRKSSLLPDYLYVSEMEKVRDLTKKMNSDIGTDNYAVTWTDATLTPNESIVKAVHFKELREHINTAYTKNRWGTNNCEGYSCVCDFTCDRYTISPCTCDIVCHSFNPEVPCTCNNTCDGYSCECNNTCYLEDVCVCDNEQFLYTPCTCDFTCHGYTPCTCDFTCHQYGPPMDPSICPCDSSCNGYSCSCDSECDEYACGCHMLQFWYEPCSCFMSQYRYTPCTCDFTCYGYSAQDCLCFEQCYSQYSESCGCDARQYGITCFTCHHYTAGT